MINWTDEEVKKLCKGYEDRIRFLEEVIAHTQKTGGKKE